MHIFLNVKPEDLDTLIAILYAPKQQQESEKTVTEKRPMTSAERQKKYRENKKLRNAIATVSNENVTERNECDREEREEKRDEEGVLPPIPPSSPSSSPHPNNIPITPLPPFPEEAERKGEREEIARERPKAVKHRHGEFGHVLLTEEEHKKLCEKFPHNIGERIQNLDDYLENNRKKHYDNHYLTILTWARKEQPQRTEKRTYTFQEVLAMEREKEDQEIVDL